MKKFYNQPTCLVVALGTVSMMAESLPVDNTPIESPDEILTKENRVTDVNVWSNEW